MQLFKETHHMIAGIYPVADALAGTVYSDIVSMGNFGHGCFVIMKGVGTTGTSTITVEACSDTSASATTAIPFYYSKCSSSTSEDTFGAATLATTAGFTTAAASNEIYLIEFDASAVAATGYEFVRLKAVEVANDPVLAGVFFIGTGLRLQGETLPESIS